MRAALAKLAARSAQLRKAATMTKEALVGKALAGAGKLAVKHPVGTLAVGAGTAFGGMGAVGSFKQHKAGFNATSTPGT